MIGYMYILECSDGSYYTGSTKNLEKRLWEHENFQGANYTRKKHPSRLVYVEEYPRIDEAFYREKQVQGWSHAKKKALIEKKPHSLHELAICKNKSHYQNTYIESSPVTSTPLSVRIRNSQRITENRSLSGISKSDPSRSLSGVETTIHQGNS
jgi:putative endonuclease